MCIRDSNKELLGDMEKLLEKNNEELRGDMEKNNEELRSELGLYPLLTAAFSVTATTITTTINSNKLDDTLKRFDDKKDGIQAGLEQNWSRMCSAPACLELQLTLSWRWPCL